MEGDPTAVTPHDLDHHHPVVRFGGGMDPIYRFGDDINSGIETKGIVGPAQVVVDGLGHPDHRHVQGSEFISLAELTSPAGRFQIHSLYEP